jgi:hypothetical protein
MAIDRIINNFPKETAFDPLIIILLLENPFWVKVTSRFLTIHIPKARVITPPKKHIVLDETSIVHRDKLYDFILHHRIHENKSHGAILV